MAQMTNIPSSQQLVRSVDETYLELEPEQKKVPVFVAVEKNTSSVMERHPRQQRSPYFINRGQWITVAILTFVNLINYMDRFTIAGILRNVQAEYDMNDSQAGGLHTAFVICYMLFAPLFGYLGDRHSRKAIMAIGVSIWVVATFIGSFMPDYPSFLIMRAIVGIGEASYSTIAPTIISDMFIKEWRSTMLAIFYFAIPVGSGLGYVAGKGLSEVFGDWHFALRGTPALGLVAIFLIIFVMIEPPRGEAEGHDHLKATKYSEDIKSLANNMSFVLTTIGFTCVTFCTGALAWWGPKFIEDAIYSMEIGVENRPVDVNSVSLIFGCVTMVSGMLGVPLGAFLSTCLREKYPRSDPIICGIGLILSSVFFVVFFLTRQNILLGFALIFAGEVALNLNWSIVADILLYVVVPTRRSSAEAIQILISHLLGDAGSPYLIGVISESLKKSTVTAEEYCAHLKEPDLFLNETESSRCQVALDYYSMQYALIGNVIVEIIGGFFFIVAAFFIVKDRLNVVHHLNKNINHSSPRERDIVQLEMDDTSSEEDDFVAYHKKQVVNFDQLAV